MSGRNHLPTNTSRRREMPLHRGAQPPSPPSTRHPIDDSLLRNRLPLSASSNHATSRSNHSSTILEDRIAIQHQEIQTLLLENQRLAAVHVALKQDLSLAQQELRHLTAAAAEVKTERDDQVRKVYDRSLRMEEEVRSIEAMRAELVQVRGDVQKLSVNRRELTSELEAINKDLEKGRKEAGQLPEIKADIESVQREIQRGRAAIECEKKNTASNLEHWRTMEKNMTALALEIDRLRAELANAEKKMQEENPDTRYVGGYPNPQVAYGGTSYPNPYGMHQVQGTGSTVAFVPSTTPNGLFEVQQIPTQR